MPCVCLVDVTVLQAERSSSFHKSNMNEMENLRTDASSMYLQSTNEAGISKTKALCF